MISTETKNTKHEAVRQQVHHDVQKFLQQGGKITVLPEWVNRPLKNSVLRQLWRDGKLG